MLSDNSSWSPRMIRRPGRPLVEWLPLATLGNPDITVGILKDGSWVVDTADGLAGLDDAQALTLAFPILNSSAREIHERLAELKQDSVGINWQEFPLSRLVSHAVAQGGYWAEQSLPWLSQIEFDDLTSKTVISGLIAIENNKEFGQELRHKVRRYRRQMEES